MSTLNSLIGPLPGAGELGDIADIAQQFMRQPRDSGTPIGNVVMNMLARHGTLPGQDYWAVLVPAAIMRLARIRSRVSAWGWQDWQGPPRLARVGSRRS